MGALAGQLSQDRAVGGEGGQGWARNLAGRAWEESRLGPSTPVSSTASSIA